MTSPSVSPSAGTSRICVVDDADVVRDEVADSLPGLHPRLFFRGEQVPLRLPLADGVGAVDLGQPVNVDDLGAERLDLGDDRR